MLYIQLTDNGPLPGNYTFNLTIQIQWPLSTNACYILDYGNIQPACIQYGDPNECSFLFPETVFSACSLSSQSLTSSNGNLTTFQEYNAVKSYQPTVYGRNRVSSIANSSILIATCGWCFAPQVDVHSAQSCISGVNCDSVYTDVLTNYHSVSLVLKSYTKNMCQCQSKLNFNWTFGYYNESSQIWSNFTETLRQLYITTYGNDSLFWSSFNAFNLKQVTVPNHSMPYGLYQICLNVSIVNFASMLYCFIPLC